MIREAWSLEADINPVGVAVATLEAAGISTFLIEADTWTVYLEGLKTLLNYLGVNDPTEGNQAIYKNWHLIEGVPVISNLGG
jgi:hypothetical protein